MKKIIHTLLGLGCILNSYAQEISDAVRYSTENTQGTARFKSMSGAFGALGGDMSATQLDQLFLIQVTAHFRFLTQVLQIKLNTVRGHRN